MNQLHDFLCPPQAAPDPVDHLETGAQELQRLYVAVERLVARG